MELQVGDIPSSLSLSLSPPQSFCSLLSNSLKLLHDSNLAPDFKQTAISRQPTSSCVDLYLYRARACDMNGIMDEIDWLPPAANNHATQT